MPREARWFAAYKGSPSKAFRQARVNVPPAWIERANASRKNYEETVVKAMKALKILRVKRPRAKATIRRAEKELRLALKLWEEKYQKEVFYNGVRVLMELQRNGKSDR